MPRDSQLPPWFWTEHDDATVRRLWPDPTVSKADIAAEIGCSEMQVDYRARKIMKLPRRTYNPPAGPREVPINAKQADVLFAKAMAGRTFGSLKMRPMRTVVAPHGPPGSHRSAASSLMLSGAVHLPHGSRPKQ